MQIQIPTDRTSGTRTRATQMLTNTIVEIYSTPLTTAPRRRNEVAYGFVGDVVRATDFPCVNFPEYVSHFAEPDSVWMDIWVNRYDLFILPHL